MTSSRRSVSPQLDIHVHIRTHAPVVTATSLHQPFPIPVPYAELLRKRPLATTEVYASASTRSRTICQNISLDSRSIITHGIKSNNDRQLQRRQKNCRIETISIQPLHGFSTDTGTPQLVARSGQLAMDAGPVACQLMLTVNGRKSQRRNNIFAMIGKGGIGAPRDHAVLNLIFPGRTAQSA